MQVHTLSIAITKSNENHMKNLNILNLEKLPFRKSIINFKHRTMLNSELREVTVSGTLGNCCVVGKQKA